MATPTTNYQPSLFDRAFVDVIEYLYSNKRNIQKFTTKKALLESLDINPANYVEIKNGNRGVPSLKIDYVIEQLTKNWDINPTYLKYRTGNVTLNPTNIAEEDQIHYQSQKEELVILKKDLERERAINEELRNMIKLQQRTIDMLKPLK
jgi:hypothetical protein